MVAIAVRDLMKRYRDTVAVDRISFDVPRGRITALLGGNGAGKTTTIAMLLGALTPDEGSIDVLGVDMRRERTRALTRMNFSSPYVDLPKKLTVRENLTVYGRLYNVRGLARRIDALVDEFHLESFVDRPFGRLSAGQQTRVSLAKALVNKPDVLLLDEPTASLDPDTADRIRGDLEQYCQRHGMTILMASHNMREVERLCSHVLMMKAGRIVDRGAPRDLAAKYGRRDMEDVFLHVARATEGELSGDMPHGDGGAAI